MPFIVRLLSSIPRMEPGGGTTTSVSVTPSSPDSDRCTVQKLMDGVKAHLIVTDPPYNVAYTGKTKKALTIRNDVPPWLSR
jgi:DNA modification methylase